MQEAGIRQDQRPRLSEHIHRVRVIAEHDWMIFFYKSGALFMGPNQLIMQLNSLMMGGGDDF